MSADVPENDAEEEEEDVWKCLNAERGRGVIKSRDCSSSSSHYQC